MKLTAVLYSGWFSFAPSKKKETASLFKYHGINTLNMKNKTHNTSYKKHFTFWILRLGKPKKGKKNFFEGKELSGGGGGGVRP